MIIDETKIVRESEYNYRVYFSESDDLKKKCPAPLEESSPGMMRTKILFPTPTAALALIGLVYSR